MARAVSYYNLSPRNPGDFVRLHSLLSDRLAPHNINLTFMTLHSPCDETFRQQSRGQFQVHIVPPKFARGLRRLLYLARYITSNHIDIFHMNYVRYGTASILILLTRLLFGTTRFIYQKNSAGRILPSKFNLKRLINPLRLVSYFVHKVVCISDSILLNCLNRGLARHKLAKIYLSVDLRRFQGIRDEGRLRSEFAIPPDNAIVTTIKHARPEVGREDLLTSLPEVLRVHPATTFLVVGGGPRTEGLRLLARTLGVENHVVFAGGRNDIPQIVAESYFTIDPSPVEAFGNVIVESMAGGKPVIAVNAWGPKDIIVSGETGILVEPGAPTRFAPAIIDLLSNPAKVKQMGRESLTRVARLFSIETRAEQLAALWLRALNHSGSLPGST